MRLETAQFDGLPTFVQVNNKAGLSEVGGVYFETSLLRIKRHNGAMSLFAGFCRSVRRAARYHCPLVETEVCNIRAPGFKRLCSLSQKRLFSEREGNAI